MWTRAVLLGIADRAIKTFATTLTSLLLVGHVLDLFTVAWMPLLGTAGAATLMSVLTSVGSLPLGEPGTTAAIPGAK